MTESIITKEKRRVRALNRNRERGVREKIVHHHVKYKEIPCLYLPLHSK